MYKRQLYQVDYAARAEEFADMQALDAYLDQVVAAVAANGMDGVTMSSESGRQRMKSCSLDAFSGELCRRA